MKRYERTPMLVNAIQWKPGIQIPDAIELKNKINYSENGLFYRIIRPVGVTPHWFSVQKYDEQYISGHAHEMDFARFEIGDQVYYRHLIETQAHILQPGVVVVDDVSGLDPLYQDCYAAYNWQAEPKWIALQYKEKQFIMRDGEWLLENVETGDMTIFDDAAFRQNFKESTNDAIV